MKTRCVVCEKEVKPSLKGVDFVLCDDCMRKKNLKERA